MTRLAALLALTALGAACTQFPELDFTQTPELEAAEYPALVPIEPILARDAVPGPDPEALEANTAARLAALRGRANRLRSAVLSEDEKKRLEDGAG
ncbi:hypothetical protein AB2B41_05210 [Marimonas sp. MJW-29]|uniref:Beta-barrel assembly machine subunit BamF n=1 Tax=Sulfitobacter sediminis TaxID=3234186 RepID=A0ABV3RLP7_9RHOB